ncbi:MAG TPA: hypothetical protein VLK65_23135 [Vicinamibacteria bacterium]|nr:hypothetical protein [Vicinamibacteria bacterium]
MDAKTSFPLRTASVVGLLFVALDGQAQDRFSFEGLLGGALNAGTTLSISQSGYPDLDHEADYATRAFELPLYYSLRFAVHDRSGRWEAQFTHHKVYLSNRTPEIQNFEISHGLNLMTFGRAWTSLPVDIRAAAGVVIAHADSEIRAQPFSPGYRLTGPSFLLGFGKRLGLTRWLFASVEVQLSAARVKVPVSAGDASAPNVALHVMSGLGARF